MNNRTNHLFLSILFSAICSVLALDAAAQNDDLPVARPLSRKIDTTLLLRGENGKLLHFNTYFKLLYDGDHYADISNGKWFLRKYPDSVLRYVRQYRTRLDSLARISNIFQRLARADKVLVLKSKRRLYIQRGGKALFEFPVQLGKNPIGHKLRDGDGRTPEGTYTLDTKSWSAKYYMNFHISYPDSNDARRAANNKVKTGGEVMLHGSSIQRSKLTDWTNGCIALSNAQMDTIFKYVPVGTLIEIRK